MGRKIPMIHGFKPTPIIKGEGAKIFWKNFHKANNYQKTEFKIRDSKMLEEKFLEIIKKQKEN